ncbi:type VI secretion system tube protein Hcp [Pirellulaceae bacterium SH467]
MILVRIDRIKGTVLLPGYKDYFVAETIGFGVGRKVSASSSDRNDLTIGESEEQELSIDKSVDAATVYLMHAAMKGRTDTGGPRTLSIDIHLVQSKRYEDATASGGLTSPYMKIRIENAIIQDWSIDASGDERPTESLKIWFNRAAMKYRATQDGKVYETHGPLGWDQQANKDWKSDELLRRDE